MLRYFTLSFVYTYVGYAFEIYILSFKKAHWFCIEWTYEDVPNYKPGIHDEFSFTNAFLLLLLKYIKNCTEKKERELALNKEIKFWGNNKSIIYYWHYTLDRLLTPRTMQFFLIPVHMIILRTLWCLQHFFFKSLFWYNFIDILWYICFVGFL